MYERPALKGLCDKIHNHLYVNQNVCKYFNASKEKFTHTHNIIQDKVRTNFVLPYVLVINT